MKQFYWDSAKLVKAPFLSKDLWQDTCTTIRKALSVICATWLSVGACDDQKRGIMSQSDWKKVWESDKKAILRIPWVGQGI
jgi:hypothetical protein